MKRKCSVCSREEGTPTAKYPVELRPCGKDGAPICFECAMGTPEREREAKRRERSEGKEDEVTSFDEFCERWNLTPEERREAAFYLAFLRMRRTLEVLLP